MVLTFIAPAYLCNQSCPRCYLTEVTREPVTAFDLLPTDYARFVDQFVDADVPILSMSFQGYEVTLPSSWPFVEAVFAVAQKNSLRKSFITNGMLLYKWVERIEVLDPDRISVSLDGTSAGVNDPIRGLPGAFDATVASLRRFLRALPSFGKRLAVVSCLYHPDQVQSLLAMPALLCDLGIERWTLSVELSAHGPRAQPREQRALLASQLTRLVGAADAYGVRCYVNDEFGLFPDAKDSPLRPRRLYEADFLYRVEPTGHVRVGHQVLDVWNESATLRWNPATDDAVETVGYRASAARSMARLANGAPQPTESRVS